GGEQDRHARHQGEHDEADPQEGEHQVVRDGQDPLHQPQTAGQRLVQPAGHPHRVGRDRVPAAGGGGHGNCPAGRTTRTGHAAWWISFWLVDPNSRPRKPPRPRLPTTTSWAQSLSASRAWAGRSRATRRRTGTSGYFSPQPASCSASSRSAERSIGSQSNAIRLSPNTWLVSASLQACTAISGAERNAASSNATAIASVDSLLPSTPTTTGSRSGRRSASAPRTTATGARA